MTAAFFGAIFPPVFGQKKKAICNLHMTFTVFILSRIFGLFSRKVLILCFRSALRIAGLLRFLFAFFSNLAR